MSARGDRESSQIVEIRAGFRGVHEKLDDVKGDIKDLKDTQTRVWRRLEKQSNRTTKMETRLENCGEVSGSGRKCPTTAKLEKVCRQQEKQKDRGLAKYGLVIGLIAVVVSAVVSLAIGLMA